MGRFDFVVYEKQGRSELPILAIELDGKEHFEDAVVKERDRKKNAICKAHKHGNYPCGKLICEKNIINNQMEYYGLFSRVH